MVSIRIYMVKITTSDHIICLHLREPSELTIEDDHIFAEAHTKSIDFLHERGSHGIYIFSDGMTDFITHHLDERPDFSSSRRRIDIGDTFVADDLDTIRTILCEGK